MVQIQRKGRIVNSILEDAGGMKSKVPWGKRERMLPCQLLLQGLKHWEGGEKMRSKVEAG